MSHRSIVHCIAGLSALVLVALPAGASAATTAQVGPQAARINVNGDAAVNAISMTLAADLLTIRDTAAGAVAGAGCTQAAPDTVTCPATGIVFVFTNGLAGADNIQGSPLADTINGGDGDDVIHGGEGPDIIDGQDGNDVMNSGSGGIPANCAAPPLRRCADGVSGGASNTPTPGFDTVTYEDRLATGGGVSVDLSNLRVTGNKAFDDDGTTDGLVSIESVIGGAGPDELVGGLFGETFAGGPGADVICGGLGKDTVDYSGDSGPVEVTLDGTIPADEDLTNDSELAAARKDCRPVIKNREGNPQNHGLVCSPTVDDPSCPHDANGQPIKVRDCVPNDGAQGEGDCVGDDIENVIGTPADDVLIGNDPDVLYGRGPGIEPAGQSILRGGGGDDLLDGLTGPDVLNGEAGDDTVSYEGRPEAVDASLDGAANDGSTLDEVPEGNWSDEILNVEDLIGGNGNDLLRGDGNANHLYGGPGDDLVQGLGGPDTLLGDEGGDALEGGFDDDGMEGGPGDDRLFGGNGRDTADGGDGSDIVDFSDATTPVRVALGSTTDGGEAINQDLILSNVEGAIGGLDDDVFYGNDGAGTFIGNGGNDLFHGGGGADTFIGGAGVDTVGYGDHAGPVAVDIAAPGGDGAAGENDNLAADIEGIGGSPAADVLSGDGKANFINGGGGNDRISGAGAGDFLAGDVGNDTINGDAGDDTLDGAEGADNLNGGAGSDNLKGFNGADTLDGGTGRDTMSGGEGADTVSYASRSADVSVDTLGDPDDGERGENDHVRTDVESVRTGSGDDTIDILDGAVGTATCGDGSDEIRADVDDEIGSGCEAGGVRQLSICVAAARSVRMSSSGTVTLRLLCQRNASGRVQLRSAGRVRMGKGKARRVTLGSKSFKGKRGQRLNVRIKVRGSVRRAVKRKGRLRVQATVRVRRDGSRSAMQRKRTTFTLRAAR